MSAGDRDTLTAEERTFWFKVLANYKRGLVSTAYLTDAVESIIAARVRAAQAQAWDESCDFHYREGAALPNMGEGPCDENPYRSDAGDEFQDTED